MTCKAHAQTYCNAFSITCKKTTHLAVDGGSERCSDAQAHVDSAVYVMMQTALVNRRDNKQTDGVEVAFPCDVIFRADEVNKRTGNSKQLAAN